MITNNLTRASALARLDEFCQRHALDHQQLLREAGLPLNLLEHPDGLIPYPRMLKLLENGAIKANYPLFALEYGSFQGTNIFGRLLYVLKNAQTVGDSLQELTHYFHLHSRGGDVTVATEGSRVILSYEPLTLEGKASRQGVELAIGVGKALLRMLLGSSGKPDAVYFRHGPATGCSPQDYSRLLGVTVQFNTSINGWVFDASLLDAPLSNADATLHALMRQHLDEMDGLSERELPDYVRRLMKSFLPNGRVTVDQIADCLMMSPRSLQRHLREADTSFQDLLDETRQGMARHYLQQSTISVTQLAGILGYADLAGFSRAFQRWYGVSPQQWRQRQGIPPSGRNPAQRRDAPGWLR